ncbi:MAG: citryl-CoA lyase [Pseudomonadota bacterium]
MSRKSKPLYSNMGSSTASSITVCGLDLPGQIIGKLNLGDFAFLEIQGRVPTLQESIVFNAMLATLVEHGMTPMVMAARLTYLGAPESMQAAIAAGLCGMGTTFAGTAEGSARILQEGLAVEGAADDLPALAKKIVAHHLNAKISLPGIGHPVHKPIDPRTPRLFQLAEENGLSGNYVKLMLLVSAEAERALNKPGQLPVNATGAIGALASELAIPWKLCRGIAVIGRAVGIVGHLAEELRNPLAREMWERAEEESSAHMRPAAD